MLLVMETKAMLSVVALRATLTKVLTPIMTMTLKLMATAIVMLTVTDVTDPAPTPALRDAAAGKLESTDTPTADAHAAAKGHSLHGAHGDG